VRDASYIRSDGRDSVRVRCQISIRFLDTLSSLYNGSLPDARQHIGTRGATPAKCFLHAGYAVIFIHRHVRQIHLSLTSSVRAENCSLHVCIDWKTLISSAGCRGLHAGNRELAPIGPWSWEGTRIRTKGVTIEYT
jgi:hypothetical protein